MGKSCQDEEEKSEEEGQRVVRDRGVTQRCYFRDLQ